MNFEFKSVEELQNESGRSFGKFGLNKGANLTKFEFAEGDYGPTLTVEFKVEEATHIRFITPVTRVWAKAGGEIQPGHPEYDESKKAEEQKIVLWVNQIVEAITSREAVQQALTSVPPTTMVEYFKLMERVVKSNPQWETKPLDLFLQYQYSPKPGYTVTFLEVPRPNNLKNGNLVFVTSDQPGTFSENREKGLKYVNEENKVHPIKRTAFFLTQAYSKPAATVAPSEGASQFTAPNGTGTTPNTNPADNNW